MVLAVNPDFDYVKIIDKKTNDTYIIAQCRLNELYKKKEEYTLLETFKGKTLEGIEYEPLYKYFYDRKKDGCFKVVCAEYVTSDTGTGIVHCAPGFGEDDYKVI